MPYVRSCDCVWINWLTKWMHSKWLAHIVHRQAHTQFAHHTSMCSMFIVQPSVMVSNKAQKRQRSRPRSCGYWVFIRTAYTQTHISIFSLAFEYCHFLSFMNSFYKTGKVYYIWIILFSFFLHFNFKSLNLYFALFTIAGQKWALTRRTKPNEEDTNFINRYFCNWNGGKFVCRTFFFLFSHSRHSRVAWRMRTILRKVEHFQRTCCCLVI